MRLKEDISRIKSLMNINENVYLKRRITPDELENAFNEALDYATVMFTRKGQNPKPLEVFVHMVLSLTMDELHPKLIEDKEDFPHNEIMDFLKELFLTKIMKRYIHIIK